MCFVFFLYEVLSAWNYRIKKTGPFVFLGRNYIFRWYHQNLLSVSQSFVFFVNEKKIVFSYLIYFLLHHIKLQLFCIFLLISFARFLVMSNDVFFFSIFGMARAQQRERDVRDEIHVRTIVLTFIIFKYFFFNLFWIIIHIVFLWNFLYTCN